MTLYSFGNHWSHVCVHVVRNDAVLILEKSLITHLCPCRQEWRCTHVANSGWSTLHPQTGPERSLQPHRVSRAHPPAKVAHSVFQQSGGSTDRPQLSVSVSWAVGSAAARPADCRPVWGGVAARPVNCRPVWGGVALQMVVVACSASEASRTAWLWSLVTHSLHTRNWKMKDWSLLPFLFALASSTSSTRLFLFHLSSSCIPASCSSFSSSSHSSFFPAPPQTVQASGRTGLRREREREERERTWTRKLYFTRIVV